MPRATTSRSTFGAELLSRGVDRQDGLALDQVRQRDLHLAIEAAGPQQRGIEVSGRFVAASTTTPDGGIEAVHLREQLVERLLPLVVGDDGARPARRWPIASTSSMKTIAGAACGPRRTGRAPGRRRRRRTSRRSSSRSGRRRARRPRPATARASSVLPVPGGPTMSTPRGTTAPARCVAIGVASGSRRPR